MLQFCPLHLLVHLLACISTFLHLSRGFRHTFFVTNFPWSRLELKGNIWGPPIFLFQTPVQVSSLTTQFQPRQLPVNFMSSTYTVIFSLGMFLEHSMITLALNIFCLANWFEEFFKPCPWWLFQALEILLYD